MIDQIYYLVRFNTLDPKDDYQKFLTDLEGRGVIVEKDEFKTVLRYEKQTFRSTFTLTSQSSVIFGGSNASMQVQCEEGDDVTPALIRYAAQALEYRVYSMSHESFLPMDPTLLMAPLQLTFDDKRSEVFRKKGLVPTLGNNNVLYAKKISDGSIHILNIAMFEYFVQFGIETSETEEFSYQVASSFKKFVSLFDQDLVPTKFYSHYQKSLRILNYSSFDIEHIHRKVFIQPILFVYQQSRQAFEIVTSEKSALNYADKVRPGESLEQCLVRIVRDDLHVADDFIRSRVTGKIDFDRDKEGVLVPRLWVCIYLASLQLSEEAKKLSQRGWVPLAQAEKN